MYVCKKIPKKYQKMYVNRSHATFTFYYSWAPDIDNIHYRQTEIQTTHARHLDWLTVLSPAVRNTDSSKAEAHNIRPCCIPSNIEMTCIDKVNQNSNKSQRLISPFFLLPRVISVHSDPYSPRRTSCCITGGEAASSCPQLILVSRM